MTTLHCTSFCSVSSLFSHTDVYNSEKILCHLSNENHPVDSQILHRLICIMRQAIAFRRSSVHYSYSIRTGRYEEPLVTAILAAY